MLLQISYRQHTPSASLQSYKRLYTLLCLIPTQTYAAHAARAAATLAAHLRQGRAASRVVNDLSHHALDVRVPLSSIINAVFGRALAVSVVGLEHRPTSLTLCADHAPHLRC